MRIIFINNNSDFNCGINVMINRLIKNIDYEYLYITSSGNLLSYFLKNNSWDTDVINYHYSPRIKYFFKDILILFWLRLFATKNRVVVFCHELPVTRKRNIVNLRNLFVFLCNWLVHFFSRNLFKRADLLISSNQEYVEYLTRYNTHIVMIDIPASFDINLNDYDSKINKSSLKIVQKKVFLYFGNISNDRGFDDLCKILQNTDDLHVIVIGLPSKDDNYIDLIQRFVLMGKLTYLGYLKDESLMTYFRLTDYFVFFQKNGCVEKSTTFKLTLQLKNVPKIVYSNRVNEYSFDSQMNVFIIPHSSTQDWINNKNEIWSILDKCKLKDVHIFKHIDYLKWRDNYLNLVLGNESQV